MKADYKRDVEHNYLILHGEELDTASYQVRILIGNSVPSLLKCRIQGMDGSFMIYYDITSRQALSALYEKKKFGSSDLKLLFGGIIRILEEMSEYLLNPNQLVIQPEYIYVDAEKEEVYFCCFPGYDKSIPGQLRVLTEYLLPKLDHKDNKAVMLGYGIYRKALEETFHLEDLKEGLYKTRPFQEEEPRDGLPGRQTKEEETGKTGQTGEEMPDGLNGEEWYREEKREKPRKNLLLCRIVGSAAGALICLGVILAGFLGYLPWIKVELLLGFVIAAAAAGAVLQFLWKRKKASGRKDKKAPEEEGVFREALSEKEQIEEKESTEAPEKPMPAENMSSVTENFGETVLLSAGKAKGPAALVSREPGELAPIYLHEDITVVGKLSTAADAVIPLPTVSRLHAKIRFRDGEYYLTDLNSRNGTVVNGQLLKGEEECLLHDEDEVDFAQARYVFLK